MSPITATPPALDDETSVEVDERATFHRLVERLSRRSVDKHFDAYADIVWDAPEMAIDPDDPRWQLWEFDPLARTEWYQAQPSALQTRIGLARVATAMKVGWNFENLLQRGLLSFAMRLPDGAPEFRYLQHEVIEESQHTLMFQEFVIRTGLPIHGMPRYLRALATVFVLPLNRLFPSLFFMFVLGGEDPADHLQRKAVRGGIPHPLAEQIMRIHVTEEARHLSFARHYLKTTVPTLGRFWRFRLAVVAPILLGVMARMMVQPTGGLRKEFGIPDAVFREAVRSPEGRALLAESVAKVRKLCDELGLITPVTRHVWKAMGI